MSLVRGALQPGLSVVKKTAPFYSAVDEALAAIKRPKGTGAEFYTELTKQAGVKKAELADRKLEQAFKAKGKMTKEEAQQVLKDNPPPKLQERVLEDISEADRQEMLQDSMERYGYESYLDVPRSRMREFQEEIDSGAVKYADSDYKTEGGSNYREMLLKLPQSYTEKDFHRLLMLEAEQRRGDLTPAQLKEFTELQAKKQTAASNYQSGHWDDANVLAHMRVQDRLIAQPPQKGFYVVNKTSGRQSAMFDTPEELQAYVETLPESIRNNVTMAQGERKVPPKKVLQIEEIQSDWHQEGRKKGYAKPETKRLKGTVEEQTSEFGFAPEYKVNWEDGTFSGGYGSREQAQARAVEGKSDAVEGVPDAPFKKNWHELAMKRLLNYAADNGYDSIAITPGSEHFKRYGSERIDWKKGDDGWTVGAKEQFGGRHGGQDIEDLARDRGILLEKQGDTVKTKDDLHRIVSTVLSRENNPEQVNKLVNRVWDRMQVEPEGTSLPRKEGMEGFYDKMLTDYLNSYGKDYGSQMGTVSILGDRGATVERLGVAGRNLSEMTPQEVIDFNKMVDEAGAMKLHNFPITPEMRESIKQKGLPLYQQVGIPTAGAGAASQMPEQEEPQYGPGGAISKMALKAAPAPKAPMIIKPSALTELQKIVQQEKGGYGARRLERAADEVPNLEKLYKEQALKEAFLGDNAKALMTMNPADFEKYAAKLLPRNVSVPGVMGDKMRQSTEDYVKYLRELPEGFNEAPYLLINKEEFGLPLIPYVTGHEGRHRNRALTTQGEKSNLVRFVPSFELREPLPRRSQEEYIEGLKQELQMTGNQVMPEKYWDDSLPKNLLIQRPPIQLPDVYAKGGAVKPKVKDSKSGKVRMTENRDTMFMELSNKKLKRK